MKKLTTEAIISIVIVILFVGSIFGYSLGSRPDRGPADNNRNNDSNQIDQNIPLDVYVGQIDSNVLETYPQLIVVGNTSIYEKEQIQNKLYEIEGIKTPEINFNKDVNGNISLISKIIIDSNKKEQIIEGLQNLDFLTNLEIYQMGLVSLPQETITLTGDENKTKDYQFTTKKIEGIIGIGSLKGDELLAQIQIIFRGDTPTQFLVIEAQNKSSSPQMITGDVNLDLLSWENNYFINTETSISNNISIEDIKQEFLEDYNLSGEINLLGNLKYQLIDDQNYTALEIDLKSLKDENSSIIADYKIDKNNDSLTINFDTNYTLEQYTTTKTEIENILTEGFENLENPTRNIYLILTKEDIDITQIENQLNSLDLNLTDLSREGTFDVSTIKINKQTYNYSEKTTSTKLEWPEDENKTKFNLQVTAFATRNDLVFIQLEKQGN